MPYLRGYPDGMHRFTAFLTLCVALLALLSPSFAAGVCIANGGLPSVSTSHDGGPTQLPNPCEMQGRQAGDAGAAGFRQSRAG